MNHSQKIMFEKHTAVKSAVTGIVLYWVLKGNYCCEIFIQGKKILLITRCNSHNKFNFCFKTKKMFYCQNNTGLVELQSKIVYSAKEKEHKEADH